MMDSQYSRDFDQHQADLNLPFKSRSNAVRCVLNWYDAAWTSCVGQLHIAVSL